MPTKWTERPNIRSVDEERLMTALRKSRNPKDRGISIEQAERDYQRRYGEQLARLINFAEELHQAAENSLWSSMIFGEQEVSSFLALEPAKINTCGRAVLDSYMCSGRSGHA